MHTKAQLKQIAKERGTVEAYEAYRQDRVPELSAGYGFTSLLEFEAWLETPPVISRIEKCL